MIKFISMWMKRSDINKILEALHIKPWDLIYLLQWIFCWDDGIWTYYLALVLVNLILYLFLPLLKLNYPGLNFFQVFGISLILFSIYVWWRLRFSTIHFHFLFAILFFGFTLSSVALLQLVFLLDIFLYFDCKRNSIFILDYHFELKLFLMFLKVFLFFSQL